jgi:two-component sensor histidine kinase
VTIEQAVPCSLILNELVANALKHAFPAGSDGLIEVTLRLDGAGHILLGVRDNGAGLAPEIDVTTSRSLGLRLVASLARQLGGTVEIIRGSGTAFQVRFPARSVQPRDRPTEPSASP